METEERGEAEPPYSFRPNNYGLKKKRQEKKKKEY